MKTYMMTIPRTVHKRILKIMIEKNDCKKWIIAKETGKGGYEHYQIRVQTSNDNFFWWCKQHLHNAHIEECTDNWDYEVKEGSYWTSWDSNSIRSVRFGTPTRLQMSMLRTIKNQSDREIDVWLDKKGNHGKSWLSIHLYEKRRALVVPRSACSATELSAYICSAYKGEGIIIIDIPRSAKLHRDIYETMEEIKDGLVFDKRYSGHCRNIRGVKVIVFTNQPLDTKMLSHDRWRLHGIGADEESLS